MTCPQRRTGGDSRTLRRILADGLSIVVVRWTPIIINIRFENI